MTRRRLEDNVGTTSENEVSPNILITVLILAIAVILCASLYLFLRFLRRHRGTPSENDVTTISTSQHPHPLSSTSATSRRKISPEINPLINTLPLFTFDSLSSAGDCAVCLSKFEPKDLLRLLPICCHAFHADCIDTWLNSSQSCPLCRSSVFVPESDLLARLGEGNNPSSLSNSRSFRVEIGNVSQRNSQRNSDEFPINRSYSLGGNFDYIVDDDAVSEVHSGSFRRTTSSTTDYKVDEQLQQNLAAEVGTRGGSWLKDYLSHSLSSSFRSSGRWFTGSSRRETTTEFENNNRVNELDLEASRLGDEIGELFRWLSGV
ncbi:E3 ubiquitin-protein ligase ATL4 isoform X1 [Amaranthus tricolor]|uniref:E3 ubiquitin-protein ligase ATL4 isoform X1 n=1 Tax=Amaranthus tricolor TaxID=29722 RepID=UPI00258969C3|nr:E3 ubiquitin-protein ligase ATL4 isoform X1 [Amaranthus tricolor]